MEFKIKSIVHIGFKRRLEIIQEYLRSHSDENGNPKETKKGYGTKLYVYNHGYHVSCHKTRTMYVFNIWFGV